METPIFLCYRGITYTHESETVTLVITMLEAYMQSEFNCYAQKIIDLSEHLNDASNEFLFLMLFESGPGYHPQPLTPDQKQAIDDKLGPLTFDTDYLVTVTPDTTNRQYIFMVTFCR